MKAVREVRSKLMLFEHIQSQGNLINLPPPVMEETRKLGPPGYVCIRRITGLRVGTFIIMII